MYILFTTHGLGEYAGTERFAQNYCSWLRLQGHEVRLYAPYLGVVAEEMIADGFMVTDKLADWQDEKFDVIHSQHNTTAILARSLFPETPLVFMAHGVLPELEQPPSIDLGTGRFIAATEEIADNFKSYGIPEERIDTLRNVVDLGRFEPGGLVNRKLEKVLVVSNHLTPQVEKIIAGACAELGVSWQHIGLPKNSVPDVENYINKADLVITLGRGVLEAIACERNVLVYDWNGGDGFVDMETFPIFRKNNFSGRTGRQNYTVAELVRELKKYDPDLGKQLRSKYIAEHDAEKVYPNFLKAYEHAQKARDKGKLAAGELYTEIEYLERTNAHFLHELIEEQKISRNFLDQVAQLNSALQERETLVSQYLVSETELQEFQSFKKGFIWRLLGKYRGLKRKLTSK